MILNVPDNVMRSARQLEQELKLPEGFILNLEQEGDWSFIIKTHALMEGAMSFLLTQYFGGDVHLGRIFDRIELSNKETGEIAFIKALDLLPTEGRTFLSKLSELRNRVVHNVAEVNFNLAGYVRTLDKGQLNNFIDAFIQQDLDSLGIE